jgi:hypothetical protein
VFMQLAENNLATSIATEALQASTYCIGLMNGSRLSNDRRAVDRVVRATSDALADASDGASTLLLRLLADSDVESFKRPTGNTAPSGEKTPLGSWYEIALPMPASQATPWTLEQIPRWLPQWKQQHRLVVIDLGPMHLVATRVLGRQCDHCYLMLGPSVCGSHDWIMQQINLHHRSGTSVAGSIIATAAA